MFNKHFKIKDPISTVEDNSSIPKKFSEKEIEKVIKLSCDKIIGNNFKNTRLWQIFRYKGKSNFWKSLVFNQIHDAFYNNIFIRVREQLFIDGIHKKQKLKQIVFRTSHSAENFKETTEY